MEKRRVFEPCRVEFVENACLLFEPPWLAALLLLAIPGGKILDRGIARLTSTYN